MEHGSFHTGFNSRTRGFRCRLSPHWLWWLHSKPRVHQLQERAAWEDELPGNKITWQAEYGLYLHAPRQTVKCVHSVYFPPSLGTLEHHSLWKAAGLTNWRFGLRKMQKKQLGRKSPATTTQLHSRTLFSFGNMKNCWSRNNDKTSSAYWVTPPNYDSLSLKLLIRTQCRATW